VTVKIYFSYCYVSNVGGSAGDKRTYVDEKEKKLNVFAYETDPSSTIEFIFTNLLFTNHNNEINFQSLNLWTMEKFI